MLLVFLWVWMRRVKVFPEATTSRSSGRLQRDSEETLGIRSWTSPVWRWDGRGEAGERGRTVKGGPGTRGIFGLKARWRDKRLSMEGEPQWDWH